MNQQGTDRMNKLGKYTKRTSREHKIEMALLQEKKFKESSSKNSIDMLESTLSKWMMEQNEIIPNDPIHVDLKAFYSMSATQKNDYVIDVK
ncbi:hypothetical protein KQI58_22130 [Enterococcus raffinosus]|uniref:hypothetical protein n=1 Tax=Enterococcus raffinosus TaxID=71452 RepID=UPI001C11F7A4|nr:hypothetical protein [Enterococcus raffinosus]MBU5363720.1 hypothetical protein [Enterococcus raffinosus]